MGLTCIAMNNICCQSTSPPVGVACPNGAQSSGFCMNGQCQMGFTCSVGNICCFSGTPINTQPPFTTQCPTGTFTGQCLNSQCQQGSICLTGNICCTQNTFFPTIMPTIGVAGALSTCPNGQQAASGCLYNNWCGRGYYCEPTIKQCCLPQFNGRR